MVDTTVENLATMLRRDLSHDELLALVGELDSQIADIDFTVKLINLVQDIKDDLGSGLEGL